jgi:hypothetical protein
LKSEGIVRTRFTFLSKFAAKFIEVAGAGLASALCACFFGQIERPPPAPATVVQMSPVNAEHTRMARNDHPLLGEIARTQTEGQPESVSATPTTASAPKLAKPAQVAPPRRNQKSEQGPLAETKARSGEPLAISPSRVASNSAPKTAAQSVQVPVGYGVASNSGEEERPLLARLKQIPSWFLPENDRIFSELPRPPMPVGEFLQSSM